MKRKIVLTASAFCLILLVSSINGFSQEFEPGSLFILNAPSTASEGDDSIVSIDPLGTQSVFVDPDPSLNGMRELCFNAEGTVLYAMQSHYSMGVHRILYYNADGDVVDEVTGFDGTLRSMTLNTDGMIYVIVSEFSPSYIAKIMKVDPATKTITEFSNFGESYFIGDMDHDRNGNLYFTGWGGGVTDALFKVDTGGVLTVFADGSDGLSTPFGMTYDSASRKIWVANSVYTAQLNVFNLAGNGTYYADIGTLTQPNVRGLLIDTGDGLPMVPLGEYDRVVKVASNGDLTDIATEDIHWPVDLDYVPSGFTPWGTAALAEASAVDRAVKSRSDVLNHLAMLFIPIGLALIWRRIAKKG